MLLFLNLNIDIKYISQYQLLFIFAVHADHLIRDYGDYVIMFLG